MPTDFLIRATNLIPPVRRNREIRLIVETEFPETALPCTTPTTLTQWQWMAACFLAMASALMNDYLVPIDHQFIVYLYFSIIGTLLAVHDFITLRLPDWLMALAYLAVLVALAMCAYRVDYYSPLIRAFEACGVLLALFGVLCLLTSTGLGDLKLAGLLGLVLGSHSWLSVYQGMMYGWGLAALFVGLRAVFGRGGRPVPLGTFLILGAFVALTGQPYYSV